MSDSTMIDSAYLQQLAEEALRYAADKGASDCVLQLDTSKSVNIQVRRQSVESIQNHHQSSAAVEVYLGDKKGSSSVNQLRVSDIQAAVDRALRQAKFAEADPFSGLAEDHLLAKERRDLDLYHPKDVDTDAMITQVLAAEQAAFDHDARIVNSEGASFDCEEVIGCLASSRGFNQVEEETDFSISCAVMAKDAQSQQIDYWYQRSRLLDQLGAPEDVGKQAASRAVAKLGSRPIETGKYPVLFVPDMAKGFWSGLLSAISGAALYRQSTFLLDKLNSHIFPQWLHLFEDPHIVQAFGSSDYDAEGVATRQKSIIDQGELVTWLLGSYSARKLGLQSTGNAGSRGNIIPSGEMHSFDALCGKLGRGLIVTDTMGSGLNMVTGDFSVGAQGFWFEGGAIQHTVEEATIASNLIDMYSNLVALGSDVDTRGSTHTGSILIEEMTVGGN